MIYKKNKDQYARAMVTKLADTTVGDLSTRVSNLESTVGGHTSAITDLQNRISALETLLVNYSSHTHNYDNNGTAGTTQGVN